MARHPSGTLALWRSRWLPAAFALAAIVVATAFLTRALALGGAIDMAIGLSCLPVAVIMAFLAWDARRPVVVFDPHGARLRVGAQWIGLPWEDISAVTYEPPRGLLRDGRVQIVPNRERVAVAGAHARKNPGLSASVDRASHWVGAREPWVRLRELMPDHIRLEGVGPQRPAYPGNVRPTAGGQAPASRSDMQAFAEQTVSALGASVNHAMAAWQSRVRPIVRTPEPRPSVGGPLRVARQRQRLSVEALAAQASIPVEVVAAIEADDFAACGSEFYVRGYLRTLARLTQVDATELITAYDLYYAPAPQPQLVEPSKGRSSSTWSVVVAVGLA